MNLFEDLPDICRSDVPLGPLTWFKLGGPAEYLLEPRTETELATVIGRCRDAGLPLRFLGLGANVLVSDGGVKGAVVRLVKDHFTRTIIEGARVIAGAGVDMTKLVRKLVRRGLAGLEHLAGIPGTIGGGIAMNCGGRYGEIATAVRRVRVAGTDGVIRERERDDLSFTYRRCSLDDDCVVSAEFEFHESDPVELERRFREIWNYKQSTQPPLGAQSVGCIFRNPNGRSAGEIIDQAGLKGHRVGSAWVSDRHANFVLAEPGGRASDVIELVHFIERRVEDHSGIRLEPEVKIW